ncbi:MAG: hypothetical protein KDK96_11540 [Chlamydiia bacterium]|nr:hypothetical protein [Chlamydiia bacterium]
MISRSCMSGLSSFFRSSIFLMHRHLSTSANHSLQKQEASISPALKERLIAQMKENAKQQSNKINPCDFNCLPLRGTEEHERMMSEIFEKFKRYEKAKGN